MPGADIRFYFDPVCPFTWMTSKWVRMVAAHRDYTVDWRFISLRLINSHLDNDSRVPAGYEEGHTSGLRLLRFAAQVRAEHGRAAVGAFYEPVSSELFDFPGAARPRSRAAAPSPNHCSPGCCWRSGSRRRSRSACGAARRCRVSGRGYPCWRWGTAAPVAAWSRRAISTCGPPRSMRSSSVRYVKVTCGRCPALKGRRTRGDPESCLDDP
jgi:Mycothiol-dependent nitroreductase Rv2466c